MVRYLAHMRLRKELEPKPFHRYEHVRATSWLALRAGVRKAFRSGRYTAVEAIHWTGKADFGLIHFNIRKFSRFPTRLEKEKNYYRLSEQQRKEQDEAVQRRMWRSRRS